MKDYEPDDGPLTPDQIKQIRDKAKQADEIELVDFIRLAVLEEREACARVCDEFLPLGNKCAYAIRARGDK